MSISAELAEAAGSSRASFVRPKPIRDLRLLTRGVLGDPFAIGVAPDGARPRAGQGAEADRRLVLAIASSGAVS